MQDVMYLCVTNGGRVMAAHVDGSFSVVSDSQLMTAAAKAAGDGADTHTALHHLRFKPLTSAERFQAAA